MNRKNCTNSLSTFTRISLFLPLLTRTEEVELRTDSATFVLSIMPWHTPLAGWHTPLASCTLHWPVGTLHWPVTYNATRQKECAHARHHCREGHTHMTSPLVLGHFWVQEPNQSTYRDEKFLLPAPASTERAAKISLLSRLRFERSL